MIERVVAFLIDEGKWLTMSMALAGISVAVVALRHSGSSVPVRQRITAMMNLAGGIIVGLMASGHLLAVAIKLGMGTLRDGSLLIFVAIGISLLIPASLVTRHTGTLLARSDHGPQRTVFLNAWLAVTLLTLGLHNLPLAAPALFTIAHRLRPDGVTGWAIVSTAAVFSIGLFAASLVFLASGQSFEQFRGIE